MAQPIRSFTKAISWRILATIISFILVYAATGDLKLSGIIGGIDAVVKLIVYYGHERFWAKIEWGRSHTHE